MKSAPMPAQFRSPHRNRGRSKTESVPPATSLVQCDH
jgi:hypothetical protein